MELDRVDAELESLGVGADVLDARRSKRKKGGLDLKAIDAELESLTTLVGDVGGRVSERPSVEIFQETIAEDEVSPSIRAAEEAVPESFRTSVDQAIDEIFADETVSEPPPAVDIAPSPAVTKATPIADAGDPFGDDGTLVLDAGEFEEFDGEIIAESEGVLVEDGPPAPPKVTAEADAYDFEVDIASSRPPPADAGQVKDDSSADLDVDSWLAEGPGTLDAGAQEAPATVPPEDGGEEPPDGDKKPKGFFKKMFGAKKK